MAEASDHASSQTDEMGFPPDFQKYEIEQKVFFKWGTEVKYWVLWNDDNEEPEKPLGFLRSSWELKEKIKVLLEEFAELNALEMPGLLIQFWEPVFIEGRTLLTTRHQPFAINLCREGLCRYRVESESYNFYVDKRQIEDELGNLGRVFIHKLPECSPNIEYYTIKEYPQRQHALRCQITGVYAYPVFDPSRQSCIGVLETVMPGYNYPDFNWNFSSKVDDLKILDLRWHLFWQIGYFDEAFIAAKEEIKQGLKKVCEAHNLDLAQTWALCSDCMLNASYTGQLIATLGGLSCVKRFTCDRRGFLDICPSLHLREGQGVAGQALSSDGLIFCSDITQFSIVEYPLAHFAKYHGLRSSFAICLRSSRTGSRLYVLEFFPRSSLKINESVINLLHNILGTMKLHFQTFKHASGKDLGEELPIQVVDHDNRGEKYNGNTLEVEPQITTSPQSPPGTLQGEGEIVQQDPSSQQSMDKVANAEQSNNNCPSSPGNCTSKSLKRPQRKTGIQLSLNDILPHAKKKIADVAEALNVSRSTLKRICREHNINRWPPRNIKENCSPPQGDDDGQQILRPSYGLPSSSNQVVPTIAPTNSHDTIMPDVNFVSVKAKHEDDIIKFELLLSSGLAELQEEITKRLKLMSGTYNIKYKDEENDLVSITCDEDVRYWIRTCRSQGSNSLKVFLMPK